MKIQKTALALALLAAFPFAQAQQAPGAPVAAASTQVGQGLYAQALVDSIARLHPELLQVDLHLTRPGAAGSTIVAARDPARIGQPSGPDDIAVARGGPARVAINRAGDQNAMVEVPLYDVFRHVIGAVDFTFPYPAGTDPQALLLKGARYRDEMGRRVLGLAQLLEPMQLDARVPQHTYAQFLVDELLARHPEVEVVALHARTPATGSDYPILASNIGRIGRPAGESYLEVIRSGRPQVSVNEDGARIETKVPLKDASGATVGALTAVYPFRRGVGNDQVLADATRMAAELQPRIANAPALLGAYPAQPPATTNPIADYNKQELGNEQKLPMTKEVVSGQALSSTQEGYSDAIKNVAGVQPTNSSGSANDAFAVRGIKLNLFSNYRLDGGLPITGVITNPTENKQRVETLKGANALMFGVASPAGIINFVTKRAGPRDVTSVAVAGNGFGQYGAHLDLGRRYGVDKQLGVRINVSAVHLQNGVHDLDGDGKFASIGLDLHATSRLTLQGDVEYYDRHVPEQAGIGLLPAKNGVVPITRVPDPRNLLSGTWNIYSPRTTNVQARADYLLNDAWKVLVQAGESDSHRHRNTVRIRNYDAVTGAGGIVTVQPLTNDYRNTFGRAELIGHFASWRLTHDLTFGVSHSERFSSTYDVQNVTLPQKQNIYDPIELNPPVLGRGRANPTQDSTDSGLYTYDTIGITPALKLLAGVRFVTDKEVNGDVSSTSHVTSPAIGIMYDVRPATTLFASYMQGLEAGTAAPANAANANVILPPAISRQREFGIRDSYYKGLALSASYFEINRGNAVIDPVSNVFGYSGDLVYKGIEATANYEINRRWSVHGALLRLKAVQESPNQPLIDGKTPENSPKWNANFGVAYRPAWKPGLTLKAGLKTISARPVDPQNQGYIPGYTLFDAGFTYATLVRGHRTSFSVNIDNLANKRYWNSVQTGTYGIGMDRTIKFNARYDF
jgi:iron complex outermembrane recepter protein